MIDWVRLIGAVIAIESGGDPRAYNVKEDAIGILQVRPCVVEDLRRYYGADITHEMMTKETAARWAFIHYGRMWGARTAEEFARIWNGGPRGATKQSTLEYWNRVRNLYN